VILLLAIALLTAGVAAVWPRSGESPGAGGVKHSTKVPATPASPASESLEGVLVRQLVVGEITRRQYVHAMGKIAARDNDRHPLSVPPETGAGA